MMQRKGLPEESWASEPLATNSLMAPNDLGGHSKDITEVHLWVSMRQGTAFQQQRAQLCKESLAALASLEKRLSEPTLPEAAADLCALEASVKHEGLIFRRWEA